MAKKKKQLSKAECTDIVDGLKHLYFSRIKKIEEEFNVELPDARAEEVQNLSDAVRVGTELRFELIAKPALASHVHGADPRPTPYRCFTLSSR